MVKVADSHLCGWSSVPGKSRSFLKVSISKSLSLCFMGSDQHVKYWMPCLAVCYWITTLKKYTGTHACTHTHSCTHTPHHSRVVHQNSSSPNLDRVFGPTNCKPSPASAPPALVLFLILSPPRPYVVRCDVSSHAIRPSTIIKCQGFASSRNSSKSTHTPSICRQRSPFKYSFQN